MKVIEINNVTQIFRKGLSQKTILQNINLTIDSGEFVWLKGDGGAGKTTLLSQICGLMTPSSGEIKLMGLDPKDANAKLYVGVVLQETQVPKNMKVRELLELLRSYSPNPLPLSNEEILKMVNLKKPEILDSEMAPLAGSEKQRLYLALALIGNPKLLILDEPTRNLDAESHKVFWEQIKLCHEQGVTILMTTQYQNDSEKLNELATRIVKLHPFSEIPPEGQLLEESTLENREIELESSTNKDEEISTIALVTPRNLLDIFKKQFEFEVTQLRRTPTFLLGTLSIVGFVPLLKLQPGFQPGQVTIDQLIYFCGIILFTIAIERLGKRVAIERSEGWLKLLKTTSLPAVVYIAAKITSLLIVCAVAIFSVFILGYWQLGIHASLGLYLSVFLGLIIGITPFAILGLELGYLLHPKSADSILSLSLFIIPFACGVPLPFKPELMQDLVSLSPFYHYKELVLSIAQSNSDPRVILHLLWLIWAFGFFGLSAIWVYKRDRAIVK
ncbi:MAG: ABC transporter ATP-binding protein/permease [Nostoc sp.]|uniref:ABC transporter ATP-binding protein/permease n=1 Tax=Nostoc sp. TaxID=1180 RepID=UPI002FF805DA